ncbi:hypothetical protein [Microviridae sp.]|nr:hypothetical protein [Microviridae sp.]
MLFARPMRILCVWMLKFVRDSITLLKSFWSFSLILTTLMRRFALVWLFLLPNLRTFPHQHWRRRKTPGQRLSC